MDLNVIDYNDSILYQECKYFDFDNAPYDPGELAQSLVQKMYGLNALGLSANQVGLPYKVFAMMGNPNFVCFNPKIVQPSEETILMDEACVSFPGLTMKINRPRHIRCRFQGPDGETYTHTFSGMTARVFQHEMMHMEGKPFFNDVTKPKLNLALSKAKNIGYSYNVTGLRKNEKVF